MPAMVDACNAAAPQVIVYQQGPSTSGTVVMTTTTTPQGYPPQQYPPQQVKSLSPDPRTRRHPAL